jgi:hypothetical protein
VSKKPFLAPSSVDVTLTLGGVRTALTPFTKLKDHTYGGQPLFCHAQSNGDTLSIVIDDMRGLDVTDIPTPLPATSSAVDVTFVFNGSIVNRWTAPGVAYHGKEPLNFSATLDSSLTNLHFFIDDSPATGSTAQNAGLVSFILVQQPNSDVQIHWVKSDEIIIGDTDKLSDGSVVLPAPEPPATGGVTGPMGFMTP